MLMDIRETTDAVADGLAKDRTYREEHDDSVMEELARLTRRQDEQTGFLEQINDHLRNIARDNSERNKDSAEMLVLARRQQYDVRFFVKEFLKPGRFSPGSSVSALSTPNRSPSGSSVGSPLVPGTPVRGPSAQLPEAEAAGAGAGAGAEAGAEMDVEDESSAQKRERGSDGAEIEGEAPAVKKAKADEKN